MSFKRWRQRACIAHSLQQMAAGVPVTRLAATLGYDNRTAFTAAFKKVLGRPPAAFTTAGRLGPDARPGPAHPALFRWKLTLPPLLAPERPA